MPARKWGLDAVPSAGLGGESLGGALTKPSRRPSPVVAQLGTTYQILSFSWLSFRASVTSWGFIAVGDLVSLLILEL